MNPQLSSTPAERTFDELKEFDAALEKVRRFKAYDIWAFIEPIMPAHLQGSFTGSTCRTMLRTAFAEGHIEINAIQ